MKKFFIACIVSLPFIALDSTLSSKNKVSDLMPHWHKSPCRIESIHSSEERMKKNQNKALTEHVEKDPSAPYARLQDLMPSKQIPLIFSYGSDAQQGLRESMEDAHFYQEDDDMILTGVFDGHGGKSAAIHARRETPNLFLSCSRKIKEIS